MAQTLEKHFDVLIGISRKMEASLSRIEKNISEREDSSFSTPAALKGKATGVLASVSLSISTLTAALSNKESKKIEKNASTIISFVENLTEFTKDISNTQAEGLSNFARGISSFVDTLANLSLIGLMKIVIFSKVLFSEKNSILKKIVRGIIDATKDFGEDDMAKIKLVGEGIQALSAGLSNLVGALGKLALIAVISPLVAVGVLTAWLTVKAFVMIGEKGEQIDKAGKAIEALGKGLAVLAAGIATMALLVTVVPISTITVTLGVAMAYAGLFMMLGFFGERIEKGGRALKQIGIGLMSLAAGIAMISLVTLIVPVKNLLMGYLLVSMYALTFALIGRASKQIAEGALITVIGISVGLFFFAGALYIISEAITRNGVENILIGMVLLGGFALLFEFIGNRVKDIGEGAVSLGLMGLSLVAVSVGIYAYSLAIKKVIDIFNGDYATAAIAAGGIILALAGVVMILGNFGGSKMKEGAISMILIGASLLVISLGLLAYANAIKHILDIFSGDYLTAGLAAGGILLGLALTFAGIGLVSIPAMLGAAATIVISVALLTISLGLLAFSSMTSSMLKDGKVLEKDKDGSYKFIGTDIIKSIMNGFASIGIIGSIKAMAGAASAVAVSVALLTISAGLVSIHNTISKIPDLGEFKAKMFGRDAKSPGLITFLFDEFSKIGNSFGMFNPFNGPDPASRGAITVRNIGKALSSLAGGIVAFADVNKVPVQIAKGGKLVWDNVSLVTTVENIRKVFLGEGDDKKGLLYSLANVLSDIGNDETITGVQPPGDGIGSIFTRLLKSITGDNPLQRGIRAVSSIGDALAGIAGGIVAFANVNEIPIQIEKDGKLAYKSVTLDEVISNIRTVFLGPNNSDPKQPFKLDPKQPGFLTVLSSIFADIGNTYGEDGFFGQDSAVKDGAQAVKSIGDAIGGIAQGILAFADLNRAVPIEFDPKTGKPTLYSKTGLNFETIKSNIRDLITAIPSTFASLPQDVLESAQENLDSYTEIVKVFGDFTDVVVKMKDSFIFKDSKGEMVGLLSTVGYEISNFTASMAKPLDLQSIVNLSVLGNVFKGFADIADPFTKFTSAFKSFNETFGQFSVNLGLFSKNFSGIQKQLNNYRTFASLLNGHAVYGSRFAIWETAFAKMSSKDLAEFAKNFKNMNSNAIDSFRIWTEALTNFVKVDPNTFSTIANTLEKVINAPLNTEANRIEAQNGNSTQGMTSVTNTQRSATPLKNESESNAIFERVTSRYNSDIAQLRADIAAMTIQIQRLSSTLISAQGINVRVVK